MRIKLDENLPVRLADILSSLGHDVDTIPQERLSGATDPVVWRAAQAAGRFFITQDLDFSDIRAFRPQTHSGMLVLRLASPGRTAIVQRLKMVFETEDVESWKGCFVVVTERKIRILRRVD